ncbi:MAG: hypothetical protein HZC38_15655 [Chloroflexi bacterium]|nr:hypothetical protein [Chloroflexota bacterium]
MSESLNLNDKQSLVDMQNALSRFAKETHDTLHSAEKEISRTLEWLRERVMHWQREVDRAQRALSQAIATLARCEAMARSDDYYVDCSSEEREVQRARAYLYKCQENLQVAQTWRSRVEQAVNEYRREAQRLKDVASTHTDKAQSELRKVAVKYQAVQEAQAGLNVAGAMVSIGSSVASAAGIKLLTLMIGNANRQQGDLGERVAEKVVEEELGYKVAKFDKSLHGFDRVFITPDEQIIVLESKVSSSGGLHLGEGYGYKQGSVGWVECVAREMINEQSSLYSPDNFLIGKQILDSGSQNISVLATVINPTTGLCDIYQRSDTTANDWQLLSENILVEDIFR